LSEQRRAIAAEQREHDIQAKHRLINQLAHELNNPLAAVTFTLHLLKTYSDLPVDARRLIDESAEMIDRISDSIQALLAAGRR